MPSDEDEEASGDALWDDEQAAKVRSCSKISKPVWDALCLHVSGISVSPDLARGPSAWFQALTFCNILGLGYSEQVSAQEFHTEPGRLSIHFSGTLMHYCMCSKPHQEAPKHHLRQPPRQTPPSSSVDGCTHMASCCGVALCLWLGLEVFCIANYHFLCQPWQHLKCENSLMAALM